VSHCEIVIVQVVVAVEVQSMVLLGHLSYWALVGGAEG
jgi:hypothetical protein